MAAALFNNMGPGIHVLKICSGWEVGLLGDSKHSFLWVCFSIPACAVLWELY